MFTLPENPLEIVVRTTIVYLAIVAGLRVFGKRELGQMTPFDLVLILTLSNAVQNAMVGPDTSLMGGLISAGTLLAVNWTLNRFGRDLPWVRHVIVGNPTLLMYDGKLFRDRMRHEEVDEDELLMAAREHGIETLEGVRSAVLETDGSISIIPRDAPAPLASDNRRRRRRRHR